MGRHSAAPTTAGNRSGLIAGLLALLLVLGGFGIYSLVRDRGGADDPRAAAQDDAPSTGTADSTDDPNADAADTDAADTDDSGAGDATEGDATEEPLSAADCEPVTVWVAPALAPAVDAAVERASDDCFSYAVVPRSSTTAQSAMRGGELPDAWVPDSAAWPALLVADGVELTSGETVASSPVLLTAVPQVAEAVGQLGLGPESTFEDLVATYQELVSSGEDPPIQLRVGDPRVDPATMALISSMDGTGQGDTGAVERRLMVMLAQTSVPDPLTALADDLRTVGPATEQQIAAAGDAAQLQGCRWASPPESSVCRSSGSARPAHLGRWTPWSRR
ncbi:substrate-binding domain-containing protein [Ornithinimicrobium sp. Y1694]|uniref:substrate-binding domain-containing protein n=1 Tax=Ornithinimicrobium sp. Y1694 TaxID=3418590 RepID=UPI003CE9638E